MRIIVKTVGSLLLFVTLAIHASAGTEHDPSKDPVPPYLSDVQSILKTRTLISNIYPGYTFKFLFIVDSVVERKRITHTIDTTNGKKVYKEDSVIFKETLGRMVIDTVDSNNRAKFDSLVQMILKNSADTFKDTTARKNTPNLQPGGIRQPTPPRAGTYAYHRFISVWLWGTSDVHDLNAAIREELTTILLLTDGDATDLQRSRQTPRTLQFPDIIPHGLSSQAALSSSLLKSINPQGAPASTSLSGMFGVSEADLIKGIVNWGIKSAKQELLESVLEGWYDSLKNDPIARPLLSNTLKTFDQFIQDNSVNLAKYGDLWKASFQQDLRAIPVHLGNEDFVGTFIDRIEPGWGGKTEVVPLIAGSSMLIYGLYQKKHIVNLLSEMATGYVSESTALTDNLPVFKRAILFANILAGVLGKMDGNVYKAMSIDDLKNMDAASWRVFLSLVYLRNKNELELVMGRDAIDLVHEIQNGPGAKFWQVLTGSLVIYQTVQETISARVNDNTTSDVPDKTISSEDFTKVLDQSLSVVKKLAPYILQQPGLSGNLVYQYINRDLDAICNSMSQIGDGVAARQYGKVVDGSMQLLTYADTAFGVRAGHNYQDKRLAKLIKNITWYGSFMVNILSAKSADEVESALDELIPQNQYKLKNTCYWSVSLSVYPGVFGGRENITKYGIANGSVNKDNSYVKKGGSVGLYFPIGIDITHGFGKSSLGIFLQAFDLGAVLNYRLSNSDSTDQPNPAISWQQMVSPGANIIFQFPNSPLVIGGGFNYTPSLRKIEQGGATYYANALRYGISLAVDVTALHLSISKKKYPNP
ncbi:MAG TPA: hypothetical protein VNS58_08515 [Puia sp.]|nr:hypothetical protein [Puia sp.]